MHLKNITSIGIKNKQPKATMIDYTCDEKIDVKSSISTWTEGSLFATLQLPLLLQSYSIFLMNPMSHNTGVMAQW